jgi:hypothetical protein
MELNGDILIMKKECEIHGLINKRVELSYSGSAYAWYSYCGRDGSTISGTVLSYHSSMFGSVNLMIRKDDSMVMCVSVSEYDIKVIDDMQESNFHI